MKDQQVIKKLELLKTMKPSKYTLKDIKEDVYQQMQSGENSTRDFPTYQDRLSAISTLIKKYSIVSYAGMIAFLIMVFLSTSVLLFPNQIHNAMLNGRLAFAPNQYERASIALADTKGRFASNKIAQIDTNALAYSLALTNTQLNGLKLKGEKGNYTAQQCHRLYQAYLIYLENKEKVIPSSNTILKSQINSYEEQAEKKLHMYSSL